MCPAGTRVSKHCTELRSTSCLPCEQFTFMDEPTGRAQCLRCRTCASGSGLRLKTACSSTSNTVCDAQEGHFCSEEEGGSCRTALKHKSCAPGEFIQTPGSSSADTVCEDCPEETFSPDGTNCTAWTRCSEAQVVARAGSRRRDVLCGSSSRSRVGVYVSLGLTVITALGVCVPVLYKMRKGDNNASLSL